MSLVAKCAREIELEMTDKADTELANALHSALCDIGQLTKNRKPKNFMEWIAKHSRHTHLDVYVKRYGLENCGNGLRDLAKRVEDQS